MDDRHRIWTIWTDQPEHSGMYVVRRFEIPLAGDRQPSFEVAVIDLDSARRLLPVDAVKAKRHEREDPRLVEMWAKLPD